MAAKRFRLRYTFWLDLNDPDENKLADQVEQLKSERTFAKTIRDGMRLIADLRAGKVDVLFELFPWVKAEFLMSLQSQKTGGEALLQNQLERLEKLLSESRTPSHDSPRMLPAIGSGGPQALSVPKFDLPRFDDDESDTLIVQRDTSTDSALNFLNSMLRLQQ